MNSIISYFDFFHSYNHHHSQFTILTIVINSIKAPLKLRLKMKQDLKLRRRIAVVIVGIPQNWSKNLFNFFSV